MIEPLQGFGFRESNYERPNRNWECGWARDGEPCHIGPSSAGICQAYRECRPYKDKGRFRCARPKNFGGDCENGPLPDGTCGARIVECQPVRTLRGRRGLLTLSVTALALGVCLIMFGGTWAESYSSPGKLTLAHHSKVQTCADCHFAADGNFAHWVDCALDSEEIAGDTARCLKCHGDLGRNALRPHGVDPQELARISSMRRTPVSAAVPANPVPNGSPTASPSARASAEPFVYSLLDTAAEQLGHQRGELACARCHHEHHGTDFDLTQMSNIQCQSCHAVRFHSFRDGHPEFSGFPYERRTFLHFDHATHYRVHFATFRRVKPDAVPPEELESMAENNVPPQRSCYACHRPDAAGQRMVLRGFEQSCGACHGPEISDDALPGPAFFALPRVNVADLAERGIHIGEWPSFPDVTGSPVTANSPAVLPPFMELLLNATEPDSVRPAPADADSDAVDPQLVAVREAIRTGGWQALSKQEPALVERLLWDIKRLVHELVDGGRPALRRRLESSLAPYVATREMAVFGGPAARAEGRSAAPKPPSEADFIDALGRGSQSWFPNLAAEIAKHSQGMQIESSGVELTAIESDPSSGWYTHVSDGVVRYRVTGHADPFVRTWLDVLSRTPHVARGDGMGEDRTVDEPASPQRALSDLFNLLADPAASYRCMDCHTADRQTDGRLNVHWLGMRPSPAAQSFTKFSHAPHVKLLAQENCAACHQPSSEIEFVDPRFVRFRENWTINTKGDAELTSGFLPLTKETCTECHTPQLAGDSCLKCHNYHVYR